MKRVCRAIVVFAGLCVTLTACVSLPDPSGRYEVDPRAEPSFDRIHDNMDTRTYNRGAYAASRGKRNKAERAASELDERGGHFNRANAGNLRVVARCARRPNETPPTNNGC